MNALYTVEELELIQTKIEKFRYTAEKNDVVTEEEFRGLCGDINLYLRRRFPQSSKAMISKEEMQRIYDLVKTTLDNFAGISDYYAAFNDIFLLIVEVIRLVTWPQNSGPAAVGV